MQHLLKNQHLFLEGLAYQELLMRFLMAQHFHPVEYTKKHHHYHILGIQIYSSCKVVDCLSKPEHKLLKDLDREFYQFGQIQQNFEFHSKGMMHLQKRPKLNHLNQPSYSLIQPQLQYLQAHHQD